jgi:beta-barrel assembly-enhancing protease
MHKNIILSIAILTLASLSACTTIDQNFKSIGSSVLGATGVMSTSQAEAAMNATEKLSKAAERLNDEQEYYLGRSVSAMVFAKYRPLQDRSIQEYVNKVGNVIANVSDKPATFSGYHFIVLDSNEINALSAPSGFVFVTKGFVSRLPDEDALAAVLAHEVAHVVKEHGINAISNANLTQALLIVGKEAAASQGGSAVVELTNIFGDSVNQVFETLLTKGYSRSQEYDADEYALELLKRAGYNQSGLVTALSMLKANTNSDESGWSTTHPKPSKRLGEIDDEIIENTNIDNAQTIRAGRFKKSLAKILK